VTALVVRDLRLEDAPAAATLHLRAFRGFFLAELGERFMRSFYRGYAQVPGGVGAVAFSGDKLVGVIVGTTVPARFFRSLLKQELLGLLIASCIAVLRHPRVATRLVKAVVYRGKVPVQVDGALLSSICVDPQAGPSGVGSTLIAAWEDRVRALGVSSAYLTTDALENDVVNAFYRKRGWHFAGSFSTPEGREMNCYTRDLGEGAA
jgi:ribosomal protein S18 acetylase RimI-like enzyme